MRWDSYEGADATIGVFYTTETPQGFVSPLVGHFFNVLRNSLSGLHLPIWQSNRGASITQPRPHAGASVTEQLHRRFSDSAAKTAVVSNEKQLTYAQLHTRMNNFVAGLRSRGVRAGTPVAVLPGRTADTVALILAILELGAVYAPLDAGAPDAAIRATLDELNPPLVVCDPIYRLGQRISEGIPTSGLLSQHAPPPYHPNATTLPGCAYIITTSGTGGLPNSVIVGREQLDSYIIGLQEELNVHSSDRYLHCAPLSFSSSLRQLLIPLCAGATLVLASAHELASPPDLVSKIREAKITILDVVPTLGSSIQRAAERLGEGGRDMSVRMTLFASEPLPPASVERWRSTFGTHVQQVNMYGQTETGGIVTVQPDASVESVGKPILGVALRVLDSAFRPMPVGGIGDLYVSGLRAQNHYLAAPQLTAARFLPDPFAGDHGARMYRTGDRGYLTPDGSVVLIGRADRQVKVNGVRVELVGIERVLDLHPAVEKAIVRYRDKVEAFVQPRHGQWPTSVELRSYLATRLPAHMIPSSFTTVADWPLTHSGKIDSRRLPESDRREDGVVDEPPQSSVQQAITEMCLALLGISQIDSRRDLFGYGLDSLMAVRLLSMVTARYRVSISLSQLNQRPSVAALARYVEAVRWATGAQG
ncbi:MAG: AMP-binding protein [Planctomycetota bacterium]